MASNSAWRQPLSAWLDQLERWVRTPNPDILYNGAIFFDLRPVAGASSLADALWSNLLELIRGSSLFAELLMRGALLHRPPLGVFGGFVLERVGDHRGTFDIKMRGLMCVVEAARAAALAQGITQTNTFDRLWALRDGGTTPARETDELIAAYDFVARLRVRHQLDQFEGGEPLDNFVNPDRLSNAERAALKQHLGVIRDLAALIER